MKFLGCGGEAAFSSGCKSSPDSYHKLSSGLKESSPQEHESLCNPVVKEKLGASRLFAAPGQTHKQNREFKWTDSPLDRWSLDSPRGVKLSS